MKFNNVKFGDKFITNTNEILLYVGCCHDHVTHKITDYILIAENCDEAMYFNADTLCNEEDEYICIVSQYTEKNTVNSLLMVPSDDDKLATEV